MAITYSITGEMWLGQNHRLGNRVHIVYANKCMIHPSQDAICSSSEKRKLCSSHLSVRTMQDTPTRYFNPCFNDRVSRIDRQHSRDQSRRVVLALSGRYVRYRCFIIFIFCSIHKNFRFCERSLLSKGKFNKLILMKA